MEKAKLIQELREALKDLECRQRAISDALRHLGDTCQTGAESQDVYNLIVAFDPVIDQIGSFAKQLSGFKE